MTMSLSRKHTLFRQSPSVLMTEGAISRTNKKTLHYPSPICLLSNIPFFQYPQSLLISSIGRHRRESLYIKEQVRNSSYAMQAITASSKRFSDDKEYKCVINREVYNVHPKVGYLTYLSTVDIDPTTWVMQLGPIQIDPTKCSARNAQFSSLHSFLIYSFCPNMAI